MLVLCPVLATAGQREVSDQEKGPTGIACKNAATAMRQARFALSIGDVRLRDGKACIPTGIEKPRCAFDVELTRVENRGKDGHLLLVIVNASNAGPGAWDSVFFYACRNGVFVQSHSRRYYYGARISDDENGLVITSGEWRDSDPGCCASQERRESFVWDEGTGKVVLRRTRISEPTKR
jgi:hypothetical protein